MAKAQLDKLFRSTRQLGDARAFADLTDAQLLRRFETQRDEPAFAVLVERHGGMVLGVCRRLLRNEQDAEDAFQATFLILARKSATIRNIESVGGWLHGVAQRAALNARRSAMRRRQHEPPAESRAVESPPSAASLNEIQALLDEEVRRLPERIRAPFVLCCLEGKSKPEAAKELAWKEGTVSSRLARAREVLQQRLTKRGVALSAAMAALAVGERAPAAAPVALADLTVKTVCAIAAGQTPAAAIASTNVVEIAERTVRAMQLGKLKIALAAVLVTALGSAAIALGVMAGGQPPGNDKDTVRNEVNRAKDEPKRNGEKAEADTSLVAIDGSNPNVKLDDFGYRINVHQAETQVSISITLQPKAAKSYVAGRLTMMRGQQAIAEIDVGLERDGESRRLDVTFDPRTIDDGELIIRSRPIEGFPALKNFSGFRLSIRKLLESTKTK
jgi:RNA polymerase sigma factor (sigma-70 family)